MEHAITIIDKHGRRIDIYADDPNIMAYHHDVKIGEIQFDHRDEGPILYHMDVKKEYQRNGIALAMMREAVDIYGSNFGKPSFLSTEGGCEDYYTDEGARFIQYCIDIKLLKDTEEGFN